jgi:hypothetical protein
VEVARLLGRRLGLTGALGTVAAERDGIYTGELVGDILLGPAKAEAVRGVGESMRDQPRQQAAPPSGSRRKQPVGAFVTIGPDGRRRASGC